MTLNEIRERVLFNLFDEGSAWAPPDAAEPYAQIDSFINETIDELGVAIERVDPTFFIKTTVVAPASSGGADVGYGIPQDIVFPEDFRRLIALVEHAIAEEPHVVQVVEPHQVPFFFGIGTQTVAYVLQGPGTDTGPSVVEAPQNTMRLQSTRTGAAWHYTLTYAARVLNLTAAADTPNIPLEFHYVIVLGAAYRALVAENSIATQMQAKFVEAKQEMLAALPNRKGMAIQT